MERTPTTSKKKHIVSKSVNRPYESYIKDREQLVLLSEVILQMQQEVQKSEDNKARSDNEMRPLPDIQTSSRTGSSIQNRTSSPFSREEIIKKPRRPEEKFSQAFQRRHQIQIDSRSKTSARNHSEERKRPALKIDEGRSRMSDTQFQRHIRSVVQSIQKRKSTSPITVARSASRSESTRKQVLTYRGTEESGVKKNLSKILKSSNISSLMQNRSEASHYLELGTKRDLSKKNFMKTFYMKPKAEEIFDYTPRTEFVLPIEDFQKLTLPASFDIKDPLQVISVLRQLSFFNRMTSESCFQLWKKYTLHHQYLRKRDSMARNYPFAHPIFSIKYKELMKSLRNIEQIRFFTLQAGTTIDMAKSTILSEVFSAPSFSAAKKVKSNIENIKQIFEEKQILVKDIKESVDEFRLKDQKRKELVMKSGLFIGSTKVMSMKAKSIEHQVQHLQMLLGNYQNFIRIKLEDVFVNLLVDNILPAYSMFARTINSPIFCVYLRIYGNTTKGLQFLPSLQSIIDNIRDNLEGSYRTVLHSETLTLLLLQLQPSKHNGYNDGISTLFETVRKKVEQHPGLLEAKKAFNEKIRISLNGANEFSGQFKGITDMICHIEEFEKIREESKMSVSEVYRHLQSMIKDENLILSLPGTTKTVGCFTLDSSSLREDLIKNAKQTFPKIKARLANITRAALGHLTVELEKMRLLLQVAMTDLNSVMQLLQGIQEFTTLQNEIESQISISNKIYQEFYSKKVNCKDIAAELSSVSNCLEFVKSLCYKKQQDLEKSMLNIGQLFDEKIEEFLLTLSKYRQQFIETNLITPDKLELASMILQRLSDSGKTLMDFEKHLEHLNKFSLLISHIGLKIPTKNLLENTNSIVSEISKLHKDSLDLWSHVANYNSIEDLIKSCPFCRLPYKDIKTSCINLKRFIQSLSSYEIFQNLCQKLLKALQQNIENVEERLDSTSILQKIIVLPEVGLNKILYILHLSSRTFTILEVDLTLIEHNKWQIEKTFEYYREFQKIDLVLKRIKQEIEEFEFVIMLVSEQYMIAEHEGLFEMLDKNFHQLEGLIIPEFLEEQQVEIETLLQDISVLRDNAELLVVAQDKWLQLKKILHNNPIVEGLQVKFLEQENIFSMIIGSIVKSPKAYPLLTDKSFMQTIKKIYDELINISKAFDEALESKRVMNPRLLFLTNRQLVEFLEGVAKREFTHINLIFPGVHSLLLKQTDNDSLLPPDCVYSDSKENIQHQGANFLKWLNQEKETIASLSSKRKIIEMKEDIEGLSSRDRELLKLDGSIPVDSAKMHSELGWISLLEQKMQSTISKQITESINSFTTSSLEEWVLDFPLQVTLTSIQMIITHEISELLHPEIDDEEEQDIVQELEKEEINKEEKKVPGIRTDPRSSAVHTKPWSPIVESLELNEEYGFSEPGEKKNCKSEMTQKDIKDMFSSFVKDVHFPQADTTAILNITKENTFRGLRMRIMLWISLITKLIVKDKSTMHSFPHPDYRQRTMECIIQLLNYEKDIVDLLEDNKVTQASSYDWKKNIRVIWSAEEQLCKVEIGSYSFSQKNEYLGSRSRYCLLYPLSEKLFINISSGLREKSGIVARQFCSFDGSEETFEEFANLCSTPLFRFKCNEQTSLKQTLQLVNASALAGVWLLFEKLELLPELTIVTLSKEIQMVQQQFIIADLAQDQDEEQKSSLNKESGSNQNIAVIEQSKSSLHIKRKKVEQSNGESKSPKVEAKMNAFSKTSFGIYATISNENLLKYKSEEILQCLKGAFRITSVAVVSIENYLPIMLKSKRFLHYATISSNLIEFYKKYSKDTLSYRDVIFVVKIAEKILNNFTSENKKNAKAFKHKKIAHMSIEELYDTDSIIEKATPKLPSEMIEKFERTAIAEAVYMFEKSRTTEEGFEKKERSILNLLQNSGFNFVDPKNARERIENLLVSSSCRKGNYSLEVLVKECAEGLKYVASEKVIHSILQLYEMSLIRSPVCLVGAPGIGKSTLISIFSALLYRIYGKIVNKHFFNLAAEPTNFLYGTFRKNSCILDTLSRTCLQSSSVLNLVIVDSEIGLTLEYFSNSSLAQLTEFDFRLGEKAWIIYETVSLSHASPAEISQAGIVYLSEELIDNKKLLISGLQKVHEENSDFLISSFLEKDQLILIIVPLIESFFRICSLQNPPIVLKNIVGNIQSFCKLINAYFKSLKTKIKSYAEYSTQNNYYIISMKQLVENFSIIALVWSFSPLINNDKQLMSIILTIMREANIRCDIDWNQSEIYDIFVDIEKAKLSAHTPNEFGLSRSVEENIEIIPMFSNSSIVLCKELKRVAYLAEMLLESQESTTIIGTKGSGKTTLCKYLMSLGQGKVSVGWINCSPLIDSEKLRQYVDTFYVTKKRNIATPSDWKVVTFIVEDMHLSYPSNTSLIEFLRFWNTYKGYYDLQTFQFKSLLSCGLLFSVDSALVRSSSRLFRLANSTAQLYLPQTEENFKDSLFVHIWLNKISNEAFRTNCERAITELIRTNSLQKIAIYRLAKFLVQYSSISLPSKASLFIQKEFENITGKSSSISELFGNFQSIRKSAFEAKLYDETELRRIVLKKLAKTTLPVSLQAQVFFNSSLNLLWKLCRVATFSNGVFLNINKICNIRNILKISSELLGFRIVEPEGATPLDYEIVKHAVQQCIISAVRSEEKIVFFVVYDESLASSSIEILNTLLCTEHEQILLFTNSFLKILTASIKTRDRVAVASVREIMNRIRENLHIVIEIKDEIKLREFKMNFPKLMEYMDLCWVEPENFELAIPRVIKSELVAQDNSAMQGAIQIANRVLSTENNLHKQSLDYFLIFIQDIFNLYYKIETTLKHRKKVGLKLQKSCRIFSCHYKKVIEKQKLINFELDVTLKSIESQVEEIEKHKKLYAHLDLSIEERRVICTSNDDKFRATKEQIDSELGKFDQEYHKKMHEFHLISSKLYASAVESLPPKMMSQVVELLDGLGLHLTALIFENQSDLGRAFDDAINSDITGKIDPTVYQFFIDSRAMIATNNVHRLIIEIIIIIIEKFNMKLSLANDFENLVILQKKTAEDQAFLIVSKRDKDKMMEERKILEQELNKRSNDKKNLLAKKKIIDKLCDASEKIRVYIEELTKKTTMILSETARRKETSISDSVILSYTVHYLAGYNSIQRKKIQELLQNELANSGYEVSPLEESNKLELFALALDDILDFPKWQYQATESCVSLPYFYELLFILSYSRGGVEVLDNWGIFSNEIFYKLIAPYIPITEMHCSKYSIRKFLKYTTPESQLFTVYDATGPGLSYDSHTIRKKLDSLEKYNLLQERCTISLDLITRWNYIIMHRFPEPPFEAQINAGIDSLECHELWVKITKIFYKNLLPEMHEKLMDSFSLWKRMLIKEEDVTRSIEAELQKVKYEDDFSIDMIEKIWKILNSNSKSEDSLKLIQCLTTEHPLLASYSNALTILFGSLKKYSEITHNITYSWKMYQLLIDQLLGKHIRDLNYKINDEDEFKDDEESGKIPSPDRLQKEEEKEFTIDEGFFANELMPVILGALLASVPQDSSLLILILYALDIALKKKSISEQDNEIFLKHFLKIPNYHNWKETEHHFANKNDLIELEETQELLVDLETKYKLDLKSSSFRRNTSYSELRDFLQMMWKKYDFEKLPLIRQINIKLACRDTHLKSLIDRFVHEELKDIVDVSLEHMKFHKFLKTASWPLPIAIHSSNSLNIVNIICSIASFYAVGLEVLRTDDDTTLPKDKIEHDILVEHKFWPYERKTIVEKTYERELIEVDDKRQLQTIQGSLDLIKECALQGNWVLISTVKFISYWDKMCALLEELLKENKIGHTFRLFVDWQNFSLKDIPQEFLFNHSFSFYLTEENADDMEGFNDIWAHILNSNIMKEPLDHPSLSYPSLNIHSPSSSILLSLSQASSVKHSNKKTINLNGVPIPSVNVSEIKFIEQDSVISL